MENLSTTCCIVGGGPCGMMLGYLLARSGVAVIVLEKYGDFFRDFRGDTVHPSTLELFRELDLIDDFLKLPHSRLTKVGGVFGDFKFTALDFSLVPAHSKFVALMPQWDFLNFLSAKAREFPSFNLRMEHEAIGLSEDRGLVRGVEVWTRNGPVHIHADLVIACDGRHSTIRERAHMELREYGVPIDVLWFRLSREPGDPQELFGNVNYGEALILINRGNYFQAGLLIRKDSFEGIKQDGIEKFREKISKIAPYLADRTSELRDWDQIKLLSVQINRLRQWYRPGLLLIGDAAHAMSPAWGVGINLAIQDAVAASNILTAALRERRVTDALLARVQQRREFPTRLTQLLQVGAHKGLEYVFRHSGPMRAPWQMKVAVSVPGFKHLTARFVGMGVRPEHIRPRPLLHRIAISVGRTAGIAVRLFQSGLFTSSQRDHAHPASHSHESFVR